MRTLAVLAAIAIAAATPPPTAASPPTFTVEPISSVDNNAVPVGAIQANFVLTISPVSGDVTIEGLAEHARTTKYPGMPTVAEPRRSLVAMNRAPPNANYLNMTTMALSGRALMNAKKRHGPNAGIVGANLRSPRLKV